MDQLRLSGPARPGDVLGGRYRLEELIGEGGMGSVWRASDTALGRTVAVKVFWSGATDGTDAARRESEKKLLASVSHPSLVTLFDAHLSNDELSYLVMEYIEGGTLSTLIARGPVGPRDAASLAADLGEALHVVHGAGIIHRDVKPANILLRPPLTSDHTFRAVLADFGIAYVVDATRVTTPGMTIGTAAYISPEQVRGHAPTPASDIYSLGLVLLEALSGRRAFSAQTPVEAISVRLAAAPEIPGDWGYGWRSLLTSMTAIDPGERPTALEVAQRGRLLDTPATEPDTTMPIDLPHTVPPERTRVLAAPLTEATAVLGPDAGILPSTRRSAHSRRQPATRRRRPRAIGIGALAAAGVVVALAAWGGSVASTPPADEPQVVEPAPSEPAPALSVAPEPVPTTDPVVSDTPVEVVDPGAGGAVNGPANENSGPGNNSGSNGNGSGNGSGNGNGKRG